MYTCVILLQSVVSIATRMLAPPHESLVVRGMAAQTADGYKLLVQAFGLSTTCYSPFWGCDPIGLIHTNSVVISFTFAEL